jgi:hypothetical protein
MMGNLEQQIRQRAYDIWMLSGCIDGCANDHWLEAERQIMLEQLGAAPVDTRAPTRKPKTASKRVVRRKAA